MIDQDQPVPSQLANQLGNVMVEAGQTLPPIPPNPDDEDESGDEKLRTLENEAAFESFVNGLDAEQPDVAEVPGDEGYEQDEMRGFDPLTQEKETIREVVADPELDVDIDQLQAHGKKRLTRRSVLMWAKKIANQARLSFLNKENHELKTTKDQKHQLSEKSERLSQVEFDSRRDSAGDQAGIFQQAAKQAATKDSGLAQFFSLNKRVDVEAQIEEVNKPDEPAKTGAKESSSLASLLGNLTATPTVDASEPEKHNDIIR